MSDLLAGRVTAVRAYFDKIHLIKASERGA
jgi:hypothetical protein